jgi:glycosyltransferase involved in cell wall biosynthesis
VSVELRPEPVDERRIVVVSETDMRDVRLAKQLYAMESLGHEVHLVAPDEGSGRFAVTSGGFRVLPSVVHGMLLPDGVREAEQQDGAAVGATYRPWRRLPRWSRRAAARCAGRAADRVRRIRHRRRVLEARRMVAALDPDLVMLHRLGLAASILGQPWAPRAVAAPVVVDLHELPRVLHGERFAPSSNPRSGGTRLPERREAHRLVAALRRAALVTGEGPVVRHLADEFGLSVVELPNSVVPVVPARGPEGGHAAVSAIRDRLGIVPSHRLLVYLGFHRPNRGVERLIATVAQLPEDHHLALVVGWTGRELRDVVRRSGAADRIHLMSLFSQQELVAALNGSDLGVYVPDDPRTPHEHLCMPTKLHELHAADVPLLVADDLGLREFADRFGGTVVLERPVSVESVARAITDVLEGRRVPPPRRPTPQLTEVMQRVLAAALAPQR